MTTLQRLYGYVPAVLAPTHPYLPYGLLDLYGAHRLSCVIDWIASGVFDPPASEDQEKGAHNTKKERATLLQELFGLMVVVFGGETFLALCTGSAPSWLLTPKVALLFAGAHALQTRTPLRDLLPAKPTLGLELLLSLPDAIGRALLLTKFSISPLLHAPPSAKALPVTSSTLLLVPFIIAVPFASVAFSTFNLFSPSPKLSTPLELRPGGWAYADTWLPVFIPVLFLGLIGPIEGWNWGLGWSEDEALVICIAATWVAFVGKAFYNLGPKMSKEHKAKIKTL